MTQYQSIYRKWRPKSFEDVVGQEHITQTLKNAIKLNRIAHAYLFSGPRGVGKTTTARIFAKALNCEKGPTESPCNQCLRCLRIDQGQSMDVLEIDGASNRGIDEIRELRSKIGFAPAEGKYKIYIIDEVHMLTNEAFNALLKTLEEPPGQVLFIFATTAPHKVPRTILSRCQCFYFRRISIEEIVEKLQKIITAEKIDIDATSLRLIAESATGSMRDAESTLDQVVAYSENKVSPEMVRDMLGIIPHKVFRQLIAALLKNDTGAGIQLIDELVKEGVDLSQFTDDLLLYTHNMSLLKILGKDNISSRSYFEDTEFDKVWELLEKISIEKIFNIIEELKIVEGRIKYHYYPRVLLELMVVKLTYQEGKALPQGVTSEKIVGEKDTVIKKATAAEPVLETALEQDKENNLAEGKKVSEAETGKDYELEKLWPKVLSRIKEGSISLHAFLMFGNNIRIEDEQLIVCFSADSLFHKESLEKRGNKEKVEAILKEEFNCDLKLKCVVEEDRNKDKPKEEQGLDLNKDKDKDKNRIIDNHMAINETAKEKKRNSMEKENSLDENGILKQAQDLFGGKISEE